MWLDELGLGEFNPCPVSNKELLEASPKVGGKTWFIFLKTRHRRL